MKHEEKNKILITGGAGFIGYHTAAALMEKGDEVLIVDNFSDYYDVNLKERRIENLKNKFPGVRVFRVDISDYAALEDIFKNNKIDKICHLAAQAGVRYSLTHPFVYQRTNILGFLNILELCRYYGVKDLIFASSSSVYGNNKELPFSEKHKVDMPMSLYAASKKANEEMAYTYHHLFGLNCTGIRFFTVYGPWGRPDMALFKFTKSILSGDPIDVYNNGEMARDFTYVDDIVSGCLAAIDRSFPFEIFNLAGGRSVRLLDFIAEIEKNLGIKAKKNMMPMQAGDVPATSADINKAREMLGYDPGTSVEKGIRNFIDWYKEYYHI